MAEELYLKKSDLNAEANIYKTIEWKEQLIQTGSNESLIFVKRGSLFLVKSFLTMNLHLKITSSHPASVRLAPNTRAVLSDCNIRGGDLYKTVGLLCDRASLSLNNCIFSYHKIAGKLF